MNDEKENDNPWDDDDAGRTLATASPSFESNVPSPITPPPVADVPPGAPVTAPLPPAIPRAVGTVGAVRPMNAANKSMQKATLVGLSPADFMKSLPRAGAPGRAGATGGSAAAAVAPHFTTPAPTPAFLAGAMFAPEEVFPAYDDEDGPTIFGTPAPGEPPKDGDTPARSAAAFDDAYAETMALDRDDPSHDSLAVGSRRAHADDDATEASAHAEEPNRSQDAHVIVGHDAVGDEATLAIPASAAGGFGLSADPSTLGPPLSRLQPQSRTAPERPRMSPAAAPQGRPVPPGPAPPESQDGPRDRTEPAPGRGQLPPWQAPPQSQPQPWRQSAVLQAPMPHPQQAAMPGVSVSSRTPHMHEWNPSAPPAGTPLASPAAGFRLSPQILLLAGVGVVCVAIFVIGIVLFVTTKF